MSWVSFRDVARFAVAAVQEAGASLFGRKTVALGGPDALSPDQVIGIFEELGAPKATVERLPEAMIRAQFENAGDPVQEAYAALMLSIAQGHVLEPNVALDLLPGRLITVRDYVKEALATKR